MNKKYKSSSSFEYKVENGIFPSKDDFVEKFDYLTRDEICAFFDFSVSTFKKLRRYYGLKPKKHVVKNKDYQSEAIKREATLSERYGELGSEGRKKFVEDNLEKRKKTCLEKYGVDNPAKSQEIKDKVISTNLKRYGVKNPMQNEEILSKASKTDQLKYGVEHHISSEKIKNKSQKTCLEKYGTIYPMQCETIKNKVKNTTLEKYGCTCCLANKEIRKAAYEKMKENGVNAVLSSSQQNYINDILHGELNFLFEYYHVDSYIKNDNIIVEYSGSGHDMSVRTGRYTEKEFNGKEKARKNYFVNREIPVLELVSKTDKIPPDFVILDVYNESKKFFESGILYIKFNLDTLSVEEKI